MVHTRLRTRWIAPLIAGSVLASCDDTTDPDLLDYDPAATLVQVTDVVDPLNAAEGVYDGIWLATVTLLDYGAAPVANVLRAAGVAGIQRSGAIRSASLGGLRSDLRPVRLLRSSALHGSELRPTLTFPTGIRGRTLVWDAGLQGYVVDPSRTDAPTNGVRLVYYVPDSDGYPDASVTELGVIDLTDEDRSVAEGVGVRVVEHGIGAAPDLEVARYVVELSSTGSSEAGTMAIETTGTVTDGTGAVDLDVAQHYSWSRAQNYDRLLADQRYTTGSSSLDYDISADAAFGAAEFDYVDLDVAVAGAGERTITVEMLIGPDGGLSGSLQSGGRDVVQVSGSDGAPIFSRPAGGPLTVDDRAALEQIWTGISDVLVLTNWLMLPENLLLSAG